MKPIVWLAVLLATATAAHAQQPDRVAMAVKVHNYLAVRRAVGAFLSNIVPDYYDDLPDSWLIAALQSGGIESLDQQGDLFFVAVQSPHQAAWATLVPVLSPDLYLDALRATLGREAEDQSGAYVFTTKESLNGKEDARKFYVQIINRTAVLSRDGTACAVAASMLKKNQLAALFDEGGDAPIRIRISSDFIRQCREGFFQALHRIMLIGAGSLSSMDGPVLAELYTNCALDMAEQAEYLCAEICPTAEVLSVRVAIRAQPESVLGRFLTRQRPAQTNLLEMIPGEPVFAAAGRVVSLGELEAAYPGTIRRLYSRLPIKAPYAAAAATRAAERLKGFESAFSGNFAAALLLPPRKSFGVDYVRVYEMTDPDRAREHFVREMNSRTTVGETVKPVPEEEHAGHAIVVYEVTAPPRKPGSKTRPAAIRAAFARDLMLLASGENSQVNIRAMIDACTRKPANPITKAPPFVAATAAPPPDASVLAFLSITGFLNWASRSGTPGTEQLSVPRAANGIAAWFVPGDDAFLIHLRIPAAELADLRKALFGDAPMLDLAL